MMNRKAEMLRLRHDKLLTLTEIASMYGISRQRVSQIIGATGDGFVARRRERDISNFSDMSNSELADELNVAYGTVQKYRSGTCYKMDGAIGINREWISKISERLSGVDHEVICSRNAHILIFPNTRVIARVADSEFNPPSIGFAGPAYKFHIDMDAYFDFVVLVIAMSEDYFVVPRNDVPLSGDVTFRWPCDQNKSVYHSYHNRFDLLEAV